MTDSEQQVYCRPMFCRLGIMKVYDKYLLPSLANLDSSLLERTPIPTTPEEKEEEN